MQRNFLVRLLALIEVYFAFLSRALIGKGFLSSFYSLTAGVRQGSVLSPCVFAVYIDGIVDKVMSTNNVGCYILYLPHVAALLPVGQLAVGIKITQQAILRFVAPQRRQDSRISVEPADWTEGPLHRAKFHVGRLIFGVSEFPKLPIFSPRRHKLLAPYWLNM